MQISRVSIVVLSAAAFACSAAPPEANEDVRVDVRQDGTDPTLFRLPVTVFNPCSNPRYPCEAQPGTGLQGVPDGTDSDSDSWGDPNYAQYADCLAKCETLRSRCINACIGSPGFVEVGQVDYGIGVDNPWVGRQAGYQMTVEHAYGICSVTCITQANECQSSCHP